MLLIVGHNQICHLATFDVTENENTPSETTTAYFSVHVTCPTVYRIQIVSKAVCPTWCTYLHQE